MRNNGCGGMQTNAAHYSIYCPKCGKPAARKEQIGDETRYLHFTKNGTLWHSVKAGEEENNGSVS